MASSTLPGEVAEEIRLDLRRVQHELGEAGESPDPEFVRQVASDVSLHLRRLLKRVSEPRILDAESIGQLRNVIDQLEELLYRGDSSEYIR